MKIIKFFAIFVLVLAFVFQMFVIVPSGSQYCAGNQCGIFFWGAHEHDSVWHLAVSNTLFTHFPFQMPNMSGIAMHGYNYLYDVVVATLSKISGISASFWFFKILPIIWFASISYLSYVFAATYRKSKIFPVLVWFFTFFGSSFSYILKLRNTGSLWGSSSILSMQSLQHMLNPQFAWSLIPLLLLLIGINQSKRSYVDYAKYALYSAIAIGLKFYTGTAMLLIIAVDLLIVMFRQKDQMLNYIAKGLIVLGAAAISIIVFYSPGNNGGFPFIYKALATVNPIIEDKSLFYLSKWAERLYSYKGVKLAVLEAAVLLIFVVLNFGTRVFGLFGFLKKDTQSNSHTRTLLIVGSAGTFLLSVLLIQRGVWWNTVQFLYVSLFLSGILAAEGIDMLIGTKKVSAYIFVALLVALTIPSNLDVIHTFAKFPGTAYIKADEIESLRKLAKEKDGVVLAPLFLPQAQTGTVAELPSSYDTAYISAYSGKQTYLADLIQLELTNVGYKERSDAISRFDCNIIQHVSYIYEYQNNQYVNGFGTCGIKFDRIIESESVSIYRVNR